MLGQKCMIARGRAARLLNRRICHTARPLTVRQCQREREAGNYGAQCSTNKGPSLFMLQPTKGLHCSCSDAFALLCFRRHAPPAFRGRVRECASTSGADRAGEELCSRSHCCNGDTAMGTPRNLHAWAYRAVRMQLLSWRAAEACVHMAVEAWVYLSTYVKGSSGIAA